MPVRYLIVLALAALAGLIGWGAGSLLQNSTPLKPLPVAAPVVHKYQMMDQNGHPVNEQTYSGRWQLVFFGFTYCPDICPTSLIYASDLLNELGPLAEKLQVVFVTVDPERDSVSVLKQYLSHFDPRIVGLTGLPMQVAQMASAFGVHAVKQEQPGAEYTMQHSTAFYLVGPEGGLRRAYNLQRGADQMTAAIREILSSKE
jgi:protein SCO1